MGILRLGTGRHSLSKTSLALAFAVTLTLPVTAAQIHSGRASANLRIRITVVPTVSTAVPEQRHDAATGSVLYNLPVTQPTGQMTRQVSIREMRSEEIQIRHDSHFGKRSPAVLETVTVVGE